MPDEFIMSMESHMVDIQVTRPNNFSNGDLWLKPQKNTVLVSHGRPPWYVYFFRPDSPSHVPSVLVPVRYSEDGVRIYDAFVIGISGAYDFMLFGLNGDLSVSLNEK